MKKQIVKKAENKTNNKGVENTMENKNLKALTDFVGTSKKALEVIDIKELRPLEKHIMELQKKEAKNIDKTLENKINIRINWIESILDNAENEILNSLENEIAVTADSKQSKKLESVASPKKVIKSTAKKEDLKKEASEAPEAKKEVKQVSTPEAPKEAPKKAKNEDKKPSNIKVLNTKDMPETKPQTNLYIDIETEQTFQVIYINRELESVVLFNEDGVIECDSKKFDKGILFYFIGNKSYCYDIVKAYSK